MADWVNNGSCQDLSGLTGNSLTVRAGSMAATNTVSVTPDFGAPGTESESVNDNNFPMVQPVGARYSNEVPAEPGTDGKPKARDSYHAAPPAWSAVASPGTVRRPEA